MLRGEFGKLASDIETEARSDSAELLATQSHPSWEVLCALAGKHPPTAANIRRHQCKVHSCSCGMSHADCRNRCNHHGKHSPQHICAAVITQLRPSREVLRACLPARRPRSCRTAKIRWESRPFNAHLDLKVVISSHFALRCTTFLTLFVSAGICSDESRDSPSYSLSLHDFRSKRS